MFVLCLNKSVYKDAWQMQILFASKLCTITNKLIYTDKYAWSFSIKQTFASAKRAYCVKTSDNNFLLHNRWQLKPYVSIKRVS